MFDITMIIWIGNSFTCYDQVLFSVLPRYDVNILMFYQITDFQQEKTTSVMLHNSSTRTKKNLTKSAIFTLREKIVL